MSDAIGGTGHSRHVISELGLEVQLVGDELHATAEIVPELALPGTDCLRTAVLAAWLDVLAGILCIDAFGGRVPVTLDLDLHVFWVPLGCSRIAAVTRIVKVGRSIAIAEVEFTANGNPEPLGVGSASFIASPDTGLTLPSRAENIEMLSRYRGRLLMPFAERAGCRRLRAGVASLDRRDDGLNASNTINGGLLALVVEEAALAGQPGRHLSSLAMRYVRPARTGPVVGNATRFGDTSRVQVVDAGSQDRVVVLAMATDRSNEA